jgi:hypothetical protein
MQQCPKCSSQCGDEMKICRTCGGILPAATKQPPQPVVNNDPTPLPEEEKEEEKEEEEEPYQVDSAKKSPWTCLQCGKTVPADFDFCWNCGADRDGTPDPTFTKDGESDNENDDEPWEPATLEEFLKPEQTLLRCPKCGSTKIIPGIKVSDQGEYSDGTLRVVVEGNPNALLFKDRRYGRFYADICGQCGHVELKVEEPGALYEHYLKSKEERAR